MGREVRPCAMDDSAVESISERLSTIADLHMPHSFASRSESVSSGEKKLHLSSLLRRDAAVFLERYGPRLSTVELEQFQVLGDDYEIGWHLKQLRSVASPTAHERRVQAITVKNRRLAYMNRLMEDGQYFSEDTMRLRSPLLHYECVGKYQDASARLEARPGERFSELLLRRAEEAVFQDRLKEEKRQAGIVEEEDRNVPEQEEDEEEEDVEEFDSDSEDEEDEQDLEEEEDAAMVEEEPERRQEVAEKANLQEQPQRDMERRHGEVEMDASRGENADTGPLHGEPTSSGGPESVDEVRHMGGDGDGATSLEMVVCDGSMQERMDSFTRIMQEKFLSGEDTEHVNYHTIDNDQTLDDHWLVEVARDAEDKYFEED